MSGRTKGKAKGMQSCESLDELSDYFQTQISNVKQMLELRGYENDSRSCSMLNGISGSVTELETIITLMRAELGQRRKALVKVDKLREQKKKDLERLQHMAENLPERLPKRPITGQSLPTSTSEVVPATPLANTNKGDLPKADKPTSTVALPSVDYLTVEEYESVPKYMKGRTTYAQANSAIDEINKALANKYRVLHTPKAARSEQIKKAIRAYKQQENKDTKGVHFLVEDDLKTLSNFKLDPSGRKLLTALRHCGRMREIRGNGLTRLAVC